MDAPSPANFTPVEVSKKKRAGRCRATRRNVYFERPSVGNKTAKFRAALVLAKQAIAEKQAHG